MNWIRLVAEFSAEPDDWSPIVAALADVGCEYSQLEDDPPRITICVGDTEVAEKAEILKVFARFNAINTTEELIPAMNWQELWKEHFKPREVGERFLICPTWEAVPVGSDRLVILLDPGQAFGTGDHPTTRMCLELLESAALEGKSVLDLGCGTGILSIGAELLGAAEVLAVDIDPVSVEVAIENRDLNHRKFSAQVGSSLEGLHPSQGGMWDCVISNIISATLIALAGQVSTHLSGNGSWIVSGIIQDNYSDVKRAAERVGFTEVEKKSEGDWVAARFILSRTGV